MQFASNYPDLSDWYIRASTGIESCKLPASRALFLICQSIATHDSENPPAKIFECLNILSNESGKGSLYFSDLEEMTLGFNVDVYEILASGIEIAIRRGADHQILKPLEKICASNNSVSVVFLTAWTAFNLDQLDLCIDYCDRVSEPYSPIYTLLGQALIEKGEITNAISALEVACKISASDELPHFQLAKAHYAVNDLNSAFAKLKDAHSIRPNDFEIIGFMAIVAVEGKPINISQAKQTLTIARSALGDSGFQGTVRIALLACSAIVGSSQSFDSIYSETNWNDIPVNKLSMNSLAVAVRFLFENNMNKESTILLKKAESWSAAIQSLAS